MFFCLSFYVYINSTVLVDKILKLKPKLNEKILAMTSIIYTFFESPEIFVDLVQTNLDSSPSSSQDSSQSRSKNKNPFNLYKCKTCGKKIKAQSGVTSNLIAHINTQRHEAIKKEYDECKLKQGLFLFSYLFLF